MRPPGMGQPHRALLRRARRQRKRFWTTRFATIRGAEAVAVGRETGAPVLSRGGGTSLAGQCVNTAVVIDWTKYCHRLSAGRDSTWRSCSRRYSKTGLTRPDRVWSPAGV